jgi:hypothetical protein
MPASLLDLRINVFPYRIAFSMAFDLVDPQFPIGS